MKTTKGKGRTNVVPSWLPAPWCLLSPPAWDTHLPSLGKRSFSLTPRPARPASRRTSRSLLWQWIQKRLRHPVNRLNTIKYISFTIVLFWAATSVLRSKTMLTVNVNYTVCCKFQYSLFLLMVNDDMNNHQHQCIGSCAVPTSVLYNFRCVPEVVQYSPVYQSCTVRSSVPEVVRVRTLKCTASGTIPISALTAVQYPSRTGGSTVQSPLVYRRVCIGLLTRSAIAGGGGGGEGYQIVSEK